ncbi:4-diphosphocytidyl-2-C-methyl-D-erythritol kinase [Richelia intracellularis HM01]|uniref:4-(cytidine 5'-diphospho)-2-C-methyl-D-erythritol kinase n=1 Tax=Richelia intracellularis TaxID=1164990 RepID=UPI0002B5A5C4|nr:4-(cytidine 5'-diphospho)-2-C-methyl-D-erythritol kinase [Richelia intracellularis]CCH64943.1 4-diphosphocytidyl-2-C-methyl-D-erythritol kinase [Richelia intracellularis HM01]
MESVTLIAPAKINLYLEIIGNRSDGYHELIMILQSIDLADKINVQKSSIDRIRIRCDNPQLPTNKSNIAYKAAALMTSEFPEAFVKHGGLNITINKHIPVSAGLAGGSSDAAAVLLGVGLLWNLGLTQSELEILGAKLGSDVPFCIGGGTAIATGRGEQLSALPSLENIYIVLAKYRSIAVSTPWAYTTHRQEFENIYNKDTQSLAAVHSRDIVKAIVNRDPKEVAQFMYNDLEKVVMSKYTLVLELKEVFVNLGVLGTMMSGSGPSIFALCESKQQAEEIKYNVRKTIPNQDLELFVSQLIGHGIQLVS